MKIKPVMHCAISAICLLIYYGLVGDNKIFYDVRLNNTTPASGTVIFHRSPADPRPNEGSFPLIQGENKFTIRTTVFTPGGIELQNVSQPGQASPVQLKKDVWNIGRPYDFTWNLTAEYRLDSSGKKTQVRYILTRNKVNFWYPGGTIQESEWVKINQ